MTTRTPAKSIVKVLNLGEQQPQSPWPNRERREGKSEPELTLQERLDRTTAQQESVHILLFRVANHGLMLSSYGADYVAAVERELLKRLKLLLRKRDTAERVRGGEFCVVAHEIESDAALAAMCRRLIDGGAGPFVIDGVRCRLQVEMGSTHCPQDSALASELLEYARVALDTGFECDLPCRQFTSSLLEGQRKRLWMEAEMEMALEQGRFVLQYQPQYSVVSGEITGMEALVRMITEDGRQIPPDDFIPIAEDNGFILRLGRWVIQEACRQLTRWRRAGCTLQRISVNLSPRQLMDEQLMTVIDGALTDAELAPEDLELEITERCAIDQSQEVAAVLKDISERGVRVAIDDFGTGYSSFAYLAWQPLNMIKMDRSFLARMDSDKRTGAVIGGMISMARKLGLDVIAEGVETEQQARFLRDNGCEYAQGFGLARPQSADRIAHLLLQRRYA